MFAPPHPDMANLSYSKLSAINYMNNLIELVKQNYHATAKSRFISKLKTIFCVFLPLKEVLKKVPFIGVKIMPAGYRFMTICVRKSESPTWYMPMKPLGELTSKGKHKSQTRLYPTLES